MEKKDISDVQGLIDQGNIALSKLNPELAGKFYARALQQSPEDTKIMDAYADVLLQLGEIQEAEKLLRRSIELNSYDNPIKWFFLAQMQNGLDALDIYHQGINIVENVMKSLTMNEQQIIEFKKHLAKAFCSIAELYLTDLCFEEEADVKAEEAIKKSLEVFPDLLDALQTLASIRLSQNRKREACELLSQVYTKVSEIREIIENRNIADEFTKELDVDEPEPQFCIALVKLLIECGDVKPEFVDHAFDLISSLLNDDDENIEIWYIAGVAALSMSPPDLENARFHLDQAKEMMDKLKKQCEDNDEDFPYEEEYLLLEDHLELLLKHESGAVIDQKTTNSQDMILDDDEEWSDDEIS